jgi:hypothetical protein
MTRLPAANARSSAASVLVSLRLRGGPIGQGPAPVERDVRGPIQRVVEHEAVPVDRQKSSTSPR